MEFLLADDGSDEDHEIEVEEPTTNKAIVAVKGIWTEESDEDEDEGKQASSSSSSSQSAPSSSSLPKADDLFATVSSTFAPIAVAKTLATFSREIEVVEPVKPVEIPEKKAAVTAPPPLPPAAAVEKRNSTAMTGKDRDKDKETAKDRVKRQRLAGQSGIGSDFKTWKSEEEMRQRQQYD